MIILRQMKKKFFGGIIVLAITAIAAFNVNLNLQQEGYSVLSLNDIEALAQEDGGKLTHCPNFKSQSVWISGSWHTCCVMGADIDACNFSLEDSQCKQWASRPAKPSNCL